MFSIAYVSANVISLPNEKEIFVTYLLHKGFFDSTHKTFRYISDTHLYKGSIVLRNGSIFEKEYHRDDVRMGDIYLKLRRLEYKVHVCERA